MMYHDLHSWENLKEPMKQWWFMTSKIQLIARMRLDESCLFKEVSSASSGEDGLG